MKVEEVHYELTDLCNAKCPQCVRIDPTTGEPVSYLTKRMMDLRTFQETSPPKLLQFIKRVTFCGNFGDPLVCTDLLEIMEYAWECNPKLSINIHSNCDIRTPAWWEKFGKLASGKNFNLFAGIDGTDPTTHATYRVGTNYDRIMEHLSLLLGMGINVHWRFIIFKHNEHQVEEAKQISKEMGFKTFRSFGSSRVFDTSGRFYYKDANGKDAYLEQAETNVNAKFKNKMTINFHEVEETTAKINCVALKDNSLFVDFMGNFFPCCHIGIRAYTKIVGARDVNDKDDIGELFDEYGLSEFNATVHGFEHAYHHCINFLTFLKSKWDKEEPFVCKMVCGKK